MKPNAATIAYVFRALHVNDNGPAAPVIVFAVECFGPGDEVKDFGAYEDPAAAQYVADRARRERWGDDVLVTITPVPRKRRPLR